MRAVRRLVPLICILCLSSCSGAETTGLPTESSERLAVRVLKASGGQVPGVRLEPSWGSGTVSSAEASTALPAGNGELILRLEGGEVAVLPWPLPVRDADVEITLYPVTAKADKRMELPLPLQMGTGFVWHPLNPESGCAQGAMRERSGDPAGLVGGSGRQMLICPGKPAGNHVEGFVLARFGRSAGFENLSYPEVDGRRVYRVAVFLISAR